MTDPCTAYYICYTLAKPVVIVMNVPQAACLGIALMLAVTMILRSIRRLRKDIYLRIAHKGRKSRAVR